MRLAKGFTPSRFSRAVGIDADKLRKYEDGKLEPGIVTIIAMAKVLKVIRPELIDIDIYDRDLP